MVLEGRTERARWVAAAVAFAVAFSALALWLRAALRQ
jgi:hypothetical protein